MRVPEARTKRLLGRKARDCPPETLLSVGLALLCLLAGTSINAAQARSGCLADGDPKGIPVHGPLADGTFEAGDGTRFAAADLHVDPSDKGGAIANRGYVAHAAGPGNRWGVIPAWIVGGPADMADGQLPLYQERMLRDGRALFLPAMAEGGCADLLRAAERSGERSDLGLWARRPGPVLNAHRPDGFKGREGQLAIVRGRIVSLGKTPHTRYLNFGKYWKMDTTATIRQADDDRFAAKLRAQGLSWDTLAGRAVEVRGFVFFRDGPYLELSHPEQLDLIDTGRAESAPR